MEKGIWTCKRDYVMMMIIIIIIIIIINVGKEISIQL